MVGDARHMTLAMMVALLLYAYARAERSSRGIERRCGEDIAYSVITANQLVITAKPLALCAKASLVNVGVIADYANRVGKIATFEAESQPISA